MKTHVALKVRVASIVFGVVTFVGVAFKVTSAHEMSTSADTLDTFGSSVPLGSLRSDLAMRLANAHDLRFDDSGDSVTIRLHACHCRFHFEQSRVVRVTRAVCNG